MQSAGIGIAGLAGVSGPVSGQGTNIGGTIQATDDNVIELQAVGDGSDDDLEHSDSADADHVISWNSAWHGVSPDEIQGEWNPTLSLATGETYTVELTNTDGASHTFVIEDDDGTELVSSDGTTEEGATESVEFTASEEMAEYYCETHPQSMRGEIAVGEPSGPAVDVLLFSATDGWRHQIIEYGNEQIQAMSDQIAAQVGADSVNIDVIDDPEGDASEFPSDVEELQQYDTIIWNSTTGSVLDEDQQAAFQEYIQSGGGYAGIHAASDTHHNWDWYGDLVGAYFVDHPEPQDATVNVEDGAHPSTSHLASEWDVFDEHYDFDANPRDDVNVLATLDEDSYDGAQMSGDDHPIAWYHEFDGGRAWYTGLGHTEETFDDQDFLDHVRNGIIWSAGLMDVNVLVFSATEGWRHQIIEYGNEQIQAMSDQIATQVGADSVNIDVIDDPDGDASEFPSDVEELRQYDTVVWNSTTGSVLDEEQQAAFEEYVESGGGYTGIHAASDTHYDWDWYGDLVGAYFDDHPEPQDATVNVEDGTHSTTEHLPTRWDVFDELYDFDANPRGDVHVLATLDEDSYDGAGMSREDHPIAWCHTSMGGRSWYTGLGHTEEVFDDQNYLDHVRNGILWSGGFIEGDASGTVWDAYEQVELTTDLNEGEEAGPMSMTVAPDGRVFFVERESNVSVIDPDTLETTTALERDFWFNNEDGGLGITVDPNFEENGYIYLYYSPVEAELDDSDDMPYNLLSRFEVDGNQLDPDSEVEMLRVHTQRETCCHSAGELQFGPDGHLFLSTGDNVTPFESSNFTPLDERTTDPNTNDSQGTAGDTSDLRGSLIRIMPEDDGSYSVPDDNLFTEAQGYGNEIEQGLVRPEIFAMGLRNPFRYDIDEETGDVYLADYGPDAPDWDADRGPLGLCPYYVIGEAGNYGWPFARGPNHPYVDYDFEAEESGEPFDPDGPINDSVNNDGLEQLPPVEEPILVAPRSASNYVNPPENEVWDGVPDQLPFPEVTDQAPNGGPMIRFDSDAAETALPEYFDGKWLIGQWNGGQFDTVSFDDDGDVLEVSPFLSDLDLESPQDMEIGPEGRLHYIEWGAGFGGENPGIYRIDHVADETGSPEFTFSIESETVSEGEETTATTTVTNPLDTALENVQVSVTADDDGIGISSNDANVGTVAAGESHEETWAIAVDESASGGQHEITASVSYEADGEESQLSQTASILASTPITVPYGLNSGGEDVDETVVVDDLEFDTLPNPAVTPTGGVNPNVVDTDPIEGTDQQALYQSEHYGADLGYDVVVPNGTYDVRLHFAEIFSGNIDEGEGARLFDVSVQGELIREEFDIYAESGGRTATTIIVRDVEVTDGVLSISTETHADNTQFNGFEIRNEIAAAPVSAPYGVNLGGDPTEPGSDLPVEIDGLVFDAEQPPQLTETSNDDAEGSAGSGTNDSADEFDVTDIANTDHDSLYQTARWGYDLAYDLAVENGTYDVTLHFAELYEPNTETGEGARVFDVAVQGETVAEEYDPYAEANGGFAAASLTVEGVEVTDNELSVELPTVTDHSNCCGLEVRPTGGSTGAFDSAETIELGGESDAWNGVSPSQIADEENPTLSLQSGEEYALEWENLDGAFHDFTIVDGNENVLFQSDGMAEQGETETIEFTVTEDMAEYFCTPHLQNMRGDIDLS